MCLETNQKLLNDGELMDNSKLYRRQVWKLIYNHYQLDISYVINVVHIFVIILGVCQLNAIAQFLKYLKGARCCGLLYLFSIYVHSNGYTLIRWNFPMIKNQQLIIIFSLELIS